MRRLKERGVTLLEMLLVVGSLATLLAVGTFVVTQVGKQKLFEKTASQILTVQRAAEEFAKANFTQLLDPAVLGSISAPGQVRPLTVQDLADANYLTDSASDMAGMQLRMRVFLRNDTVPGNPNAIEIITTTENAAANDGQLFPDLLDTAWFGRGKIGIMANAAPYDITSFRSVSNEWRLPLGDLGTNYVTTVPAGLPATGYLAAYARMSGETIFNADVLYRIPVAGSPELNRMSTDLNMGGNNVCGDIDATGTCVPDESTATVDRLSAANVQLTGDGGYALSTENTLEVGNTLTINGGMAVYADDDDATADLRTPVITAPTGTVSAATVTTNDLDVGDEGLIAENIRTDTLTSARMIVNNRLQTANAGITTGTLQLGSCPAGDPTCLAPGTPVLNTGVLSSQTGVAGSTRVNGIYSANTAGTHTVTDNLRATGSVNLSSVTAESQAQFRNLCYTGTNGQTVDDIEACP